MDLYRMKVRRVEYGEPLSHDDHPIHRVPYQRFQTIDRHYDSDKSALSGFSSRIAEMNSRILGGDDKHCHIALPMWIKRQSIGGKKWINIIKEISRHPYANG